MYDDSFLRGFPEPAPFPLGDLHGPKRLLHIAYPCVGIAGSHPMVSQMRLATIPCNFYDVESKCKVVLTKLFAESHHPVELNLGTKCGDLMQTPLSLLALPEILWCGSPCPPWARHGNKGGVQNLRSHVFTRLLCWIVHFIRAGTLRVAILENVSSILKKWNGMSDNFMNIVLKTMRAEVPQFSWDVIVLSAKEYLLPQERARMFLKGYRKTVLQTYLHQ